MSAIKFIILFLCCLLTVQHIQIEQRKDRDAVARWHDMRARWGARSAPAVTPLGVALASPAAPYVLGAMAMGAGAAWCWSHGGKEAWVSMSGALMNGAAVASDFVKSNIASANGDDLSPGVGAYITTEELADMGDDFEYADGQIVQGTIPGYPYALPGRPANFKPAGKSEKTLVYYQYEMTRKTLRSFPATAAGGGLWSIYVQGAMNNVNYAYCWYEYFSDASPSDIARADALELSGAFANPLPGYFTPDEIVGAAANAWGALKDSAFAGMDFLVDSITPSMPDDFLAEYEIPQVKVVGQTEDGKVVDDKGQVWPAPPGVIGALNPPVVAPGSSTPVPIVPSPGSTSPGSASPASPSTPQVLIPNTSWAPVVSAGYPAGATLVGVVPQQGIVYTPPGAIAGAPPVYLPLAPEVVNALPSTLPVASIPSAAVPTNPAVPTAPGQEVTLPEVHVSGNLNNPTPDQLEPVAEDRVEASKQRFYAAVQELIDTYSGLFELNLSGTGHLPVWNWVLMGKNVTIDFNDYATELNWIGLAVMLIATISAIFIVFD